jgi:hypothetical protein
MRLTVIIFFFTICLSSCSAKDASDDINLDSKESESQQAVRSPQTQATYTNEDAAVQFSFKQDRTYGSTDDILLGVFNAIEVDSLNRVFIADRDQTKIHVFHSDGTFITSLGREGRGPGEFFEIRTDTFIRIISGKLYVTDGDTRFPHRVHVFSLNDLTFSRTLVIVADNKEEYAKDLVGYNATRVYPLKSGNFLIPYRRPEYAYRDQISYIRYMIQNSDRTILGGPVLEQQDRINLIYLVENTARPYNAIRTFPFFGKSLFAISDNEEIYTARSEEFKINVQDTKGTILRTISHPYTNLPVTRGELIDLYEEKKTSPMGDGVEEAMISEADSLPDTWPALKDLIVDDDNRLWVSTIVEDFEIYEWWVLEESGELITTFEWPRNEPIEVIKNGNMYTRQTDKETGLQQVVRYRIEME